MAAPPRYSTPAVQLHRLALEGRAAGIGVDEFWARATRPGKGTITPKSASVPEERRESVIWPSDSWDSRL